MTVMVRDEADIIDAMLAHHLAQGVDKIIVTDNGSVDGTTQILQRYADAGTIDLRHDPVHRKQQSVTVTGMARDAATLYNADWVLNADADEFWLAQDPSLTLREALAQISPDLRSFIVPVIDMTGLPALEGSGLGRLCFRDERSNAQLNEVGLLAHSTHDCVHVGDPEVSVAQGNHYVNIASQGEPDPRFALEVRHFPWRSWEQFRRKVENSGRAYEANPELKPSPNHHGMRDYRSLQDGTLKARYISRSISPAQEKEAREGISPDFVRDERIAALDLPTTADVPFTAEEDHNERRIGRLLARLDGAADELSRERSAHKETEERWETTVHELAGARELAAQLRTENDQLIHTVDNFASRRVVRWADAARRALPR